MYKVIRETFREVRKSFHNFATPADALKAFYAQMRVGRRGSRTYPRTLLLRHRLTPWLVEVRVGTTDVYVVHEVMSAEVYGVVREYVPDLSTVVDLGANTGISIHYWKLLNQNVRILAVEPEPSNFEQMLRNARGLPGPETLGVQCAVGPAKGTVEIAASDGAWAAKTVPVGERIGTTVEVRTIPDLLQEFGEPALIDLLKCDIEGAEFGLFRECGAWICRFRFVMIELHGAYTPELLIADIERGGRAVIKRFHSFAYGLHNLLLELSDQQHGWPVGGTERMLKQ